MFEKTYPMISRLLTILVLAGFLPAGSAFAEEPSERFEESKELRSAEESCSLEMIQGGIHCIREDGLASWQFHHPALLDYSEEVDPREPAAGHFPAGPLRVGDRLFYGVEHDLIELDPGAGVIVGRRRMNAPIQTIDLAEDKQDTLELTLEFEKQPLDLREWELSEPVSERFVVVLGVDDPAPPNDVWDNWGVPGLSRTGISWAGRSFREIDDPLPLETLVALQQRDPYDLSLLTQLTGEDYFEDFLRLQGHELIGADGSPEREDYLQAELRRVWDEILDEVSTSTGPPWQDLIYFSWKLEEDLRHRELAGDLFELGYEKMLEAGVEPHRFLSGSTNLLLAEQTTRRLIEDAIAAEDVERVKRLSERRFRMAPGIQGGDWAWQQLALWIEEQGYPHEHWRQRARENAEYSPHPTLVEATIAAQRHEAIYRGISYALIVFAFLVGIQGGLMRRREQDRSEKKGRWWLPVVTLRQVVGLLLLAAVMVISFYPAGTHLRIVHGLHKAPPNLLSDSVAAPDVRTQLEQLAPSSARDELIEISHREWEAIKRGEPILEKPPIYPLLVDAVTVDAHASQRAYSQGGCLSGAFVFGDRSSWSWLYLPVALIFWLLIGAIVGNRLPQTGRWLLRITPGGAPGLAPVGGLLLGGLLGALWYLIWGQDYTIIEATTAMWVDWSFGLSGIAEYEISPDHSASPNILWAFAAIALVILIQGVAVALEIRSERTETS